MGRSIRTHSFRRSVPTATCTSFPRLREADRRVTQGGRCRCRSPPYLPPNPAWVADTHEPAWVLCRQTYHLERTRSDDRCPRAFRAAFLPVAQPALGVSDAVLGRQYRGSA